MAAYVRFLPHYNIKQHLIFNMILDFRPNRPTSVTDENGLLIETTTASGGPGNRAANETSSLEKSARIDDDVKAMLNI